MPPMLLCRWVQITAAVLWAGTAILRLLAHGTDPGGLRAWNRLAGGCWAALLVAGACQLGLTASAMSGEGLSGEVLGQVIGGTSFGAVWRVRMCLLAGMGLVPFLRPALARDVAGALLAATLLANLVWAAHAHASAHSAWLLPLNVAHAVAAGAWPGGLVPLAMLLAQARRDERTLPATLIVTRRFSRLSVAAVGVLAFSGLLNACGLVGPLSARWTGVYGRLLLCKAVLFGVMVGLGAINRRRLGGPDTADAIAPLRRNVAWECALAAAVLLVTELLAMTAPVS